MVRVPSPLSPTSRRAHTLLELGVVVALLGLALSVTLPVGRAALDRWVVRSVRDQALAALHRVRMEARIHGGASLKVDGSAGTLTARTGDSVLWVRRDPAEAAVSVSLPDGSPETEILWDALGLGVISSRTLVFRRGAAEARLVVSSRGRGSRR